MITISLTGHHEKLAPDHRIEQYHDPKPLLYHQVRTYEALKRASLVMNTYPTGTGKTTAAQLRLLHPDQQGHNTLLIAPTNALIEQHVEDTRSFIAANNLKLRVLPINAATIRDLSPEVRRGEVLQRLIANPLTFSEQLGLPDDAQKMPFVAVTNPDIFYLALFFRYGRLDQRNVWETFLRRFRYIVIDEFHYYDNKQFANFLFFFAMWKEWGYFATGSKICLLSATPRDTVYQYLNRLFGADGWVRISPDNEPAESADLPTTPTLAPLQLTILDDTVEHWASANRGMIEQWQQEEQDTAIISSSLAQINRMYYQSVAHLEPVRITGPESAENRRKIRPLVLATPTVDIGYNFGRPGKLRQSIDCLVCDAKFGDELTQRIGRAGRVLGRNQTQQPSIGYVLVSSDALVELRLYDGQTLDRFQWASIVAGLQHLPTKHRLESYIRSHAIKESFYPLHRIYELTPQEKQAEDTLFETVCEVFAPDTKQTFKGLTAFFRVYDRRREWLKSSETDRWRMDGQYMRTLRHHFDSYNLWFQSSNYNQTPQNPSKQDIVNFIESQVCVTDAIFNFREAWQGPVAAVYDPLHLLSSDTLNRFDLLHLYANYELTLFPSKAVFEKEAGNAGDADFYVYLRGFRPIPLSIGFAYTSEYADDEFAWRFCRRIVGIRGLRLIAKEQGLTQSVAVPSEIANAITNQLIPCLIVESEINGALINVLRGSPFYTRELVVDFDYTTKTYSILTGSAAFHVVSEPRLIRSFKLMEKQLMPKAIFL